ncbi:MAG: nucleotidyltransferase family protein [Acutalibacteraceae bacterium]
MKISCVISEFNPFHNGHRYLIQRQRENGATHIVAVMSGSFVQRGECAVLGKFSRAYSALLNGVDLVLELPTVWACAAAPVFAKGGVSIIKSMGVADSIFFGSECGDIGLITECAKALLSEEFKAAASNNVNNIHSYAAAVQQSVIETAGEECGKILSSPNNLLAVEYVKELIAQDVGIQAETISRTGAEHDSSVSSGEFASASILRENINDINALKGFVPDNTIPIIDSALKTGDIANMQSLERVIMCALRTADSQSLERLPDVSEGLENRLKAALNGSKNLDEVMSQAVCRRYSAPRIRRALCSLLLGVDKKMQALMPPYIRVLGLNSNGSEILRLMKKSCTVPVITKTAHYKTLLDDNAARIFEKDILATDMRSLASNQPMGQDFLQSAKVQRRRCNE